MNSPAFLAEQLKLPVLLIHGGADDITPLAQGTAMRAALQQAGNPPEYLQVSSEGHAFFLPANELKVLEMLEMLLARPLGALVQLSLSFHPGKEKGHPKVACWHHADALAHPREARQKL